jgi:hypothetical protein
MSYLINSIVRILLLDIFNEIAMRFLTTPNLNIRVYEGLCGKFLVNEVFFDRCIFLPKMLKPGKDSHIISDKP